MARRTAVHASVSFATLLAAAGCAPGAHAGCEHAPDGVEPAVHTGPGEWQRDGLAPLLAEAWRAGGTRDGEELAFPVHATANANGVVAIPDFALAELMLVEPHGTWRGELVRRGSGPGEMQAPVAAGWDADGRLAVLDVVGAKILVLDARGNVLDERGVPTSFTAPIVASGELRGAAVHPSGLALLQPGLVPVADAASSGVAAAIALRLAPGAARPDTIAATQVATLQSPQLGGFTAPGALEPSVAIAPDGRVAVAAHTTSYAIDVFAPDGRHERRICRADAEPLPWSAEERGEHGPPGMDAVLATVRATTLPAARPALGRVFVAADGRIWAQRTRRAPLDEFAALHGAPGGVWDVFEGDGRYLGDITAPAGARLQTATRDRVWAFVEGELGELWLVAYDLSGAR
jgi:hypothetical protein